MKKYIVSMMMVLPLLAGCKKATAPATVPDGGEKMTFTASISPVKSHFNDPSSPQLHWDTTDKIAVYSVPFFDLVNREGGSYAHNFHAVASIASIEDGGVSAVFETNESKSSWFLDPNLQSDYDDMYIFLAYYPMSDSSCKEVSTEVRGAYTYYYFPFTVPQEQDGSSYSDYQIMYDPGSESPVLKSAVMEEDAQVAFTHMRPVTAMLHLTLQLPEDMSASLTSLEVTLEGSGASSTAISGAAALNLVVDKGENAEFLPVFEDESSGDEYLTAEESGTSYPSILVNLDGMSVTDQPSDDLYVVMIPCRTENAEMKIRFKALDTEGKYYVSRYLLNDLGELRHTHWYGFRGGRRYNGNSTLQPIEVAPEADGAGTYHQGGQITEE